MVGMLSCSADNMRVVCCAVPAGAMLSGLREAARAVQLLRGPAAADAAALVSSRTETLSKTDKRKRLEGGATAALCPADAIPVDCPQGTLVALVAQRQLVAATNPPFHVLSANPPFHMLFAFLGACIAICARLHACLLQSNFNINPNCLCVLLAVVAAEADADRSKKQKRDKKRDKDQGKAGAKGKKGKGGKAKQEAGSSEEEEEEEQSEEEQRGGRRRGAGAGWLNVGCHTAVDPACTISASTFCGCAVRTSHTCMHVLQVGRTQARPAALHWDPFDGHLQAPCCVCHHQRVPVQYPLVCPPAPPP